MLTGRKRENDGAGKSASSWQKHELIKAAIEAQAAKASKVFRGKGVIVDMHAHDGGGVEHPQLDMFGDYDSTSSAGIALLIARRYGCDLVLCEKKRERLMLLKDRFGSFPIYLPNHYHLMDFDFARYQWAIVLNDPNGPSEHGVDVLIDISSKPRLASDFIVMVNDGALARLDGVRDCCPSDSEKPNGAMIIAMRQTKSAYAWMRDPQKWKETLGKRFVAYSHFTTSGNGYKGRLMMISNSLANLNKEIFVC